MGVGVAIQKAKRWRTFDDARAFVHELGLPNRRAWQAWAKTAARPRDIPSRPDQVYRDEWCGWDHWLRAPAQAPGLPHPLTIATLPAWPSPDPDGVSWRYWYVLQYLTAKGTYKRRRWRPFEEARAFVHSLGLPHQRAWQAWSRTAARPYGIPSNPERVYKRSGWVSWGDWLGTGTVATQLRRYRPFVEARAFAHMLGLRDADAWRAWAKTAARPPAVPAVPNEVYEKQGWVSWGDWLGNGNRYRGSWRPFEEARAFAHALHLPSAEAWRAWAQTGARPPDIPAKPERVYRAQGWSNWRDWLGTTGIVIVRRRAYRPFGEARAFARALGLRSGGGWYAWAKTGAKPADIPKDPARAYKDEGWVSWGDWLGTGRIANQSRTYRPFAQARAFARTLGLSSTKAWQAWAKAGTRPGDIPGDPSKAYKGQGWAGWGDWLGTGRASTRYRTFRSFEEARAFARSLCLPTVEAWRSWAKTEARPPDIPADPAKAYRRRGWMGWSGWLGSGEE